MAPRSGCSVDRARSTSRCERGCDMAQSLLSPIAKRWLYLIHRWIGVTSCLLFLMWFLSGLVMLYVPYPALSDREALAGQPSIDWLKVHVPPREAEQLAGLPEQPRAMRLEMMANRPVWRVTGRAGELVTIDADTATPVREIGSAEAARIASAFGRAPVAAIAAVERDQWTVAGRYDPHRPLWRAALRGLGGRALYISSRTGAVMLDTDAHERFWNWLGAVPHWIYPTALRQHPEGWRQVVIWVAGPCVLAAITGMWIGLLRVRLGRRRFKGGRVTPYRGWMLWHHVAGLTGGVMLSFWIVSGWLSVDPGHLFRGPGLNDRAVARYEYAELPPINLARVTAAGPSGIVRLEVIRAAGLFSLELRSSKRRVVVVDDGVSNSPNITRLVGAARGLVSGGAVARVTKMTAPDFYWYGVGAEPQLPVLRLRFDDPSATWLYLDPATGAVLSSIDRRGRVYRVVYDLLHRWDVTVLITNPPVRRAWIWLFSIAGIVTSVSGVLLGWRRAARTIILRRLGVRPLPLSHSGGPQSQRTSLVVQHEPTAGFGK
jgi:hypothetical protein